MADFQLPSDGSVLIVDDKIEEALPLIKLLSQKGIAFTYFSGKNTELPPVLNRNQKIRLVFVDIQLFGPSDSHSYSQNILRILDSVLPDNNGPYVLIIWSTVQTVHADTLEEQVTSTTYLNRPITVLRLDKASFFQSKQDDSIKEDLIDKIDSTLGTRFNIDDLNAIKEVVGAELLPKKSVEAKPNALKLIYAAIQDKLKKTETFNLFTLWEGLIHKASGDIIKDYSSLHETNDYWQDNLKYSIYRMAYAQLGKTVDTVPESELIKNALKTLNQTFLDVVENKISNVSNLPGTTRIERDNISFSKKINNIEYRIKWKATSGKHQVYINNNLIPAGDRGVDKINDLLKKGRTADEKTHIANIVSEYLSIKPEINSRLLIEFSNPNFIQPGHVYKKEVADWKRRKELLKNYFKKNSQVLDSEGEYLIRSNELKKNIFIELEVTPMCDYVQGKWMKSRLLPGLLVLEKYCNDLQSPESFYSQIPLLKIKGQSYKPVFDFRLLKSVDIEKDQNKLQKPLFRTRNELFADILSRLSSHASRVGIAFFE